MNDGRRTVLITGGSGGIGLELGKLFAADGYRLVLVAMPGEDLKHAGDILQAISPFTNIFLLEKDLSRPGAATEVYDFTLSHNLTVDVLVNCAGFGTYGHVNDIDIERELAMLQLHIGTLYHLTRLYLREMVERNNGQVINMSSISAFQPNPTFATYGASKSFILNFSRALNYELREQGSGVRVLAVCPTAVKGTGFQTAARMECSRAFSSWMATTPAIVARDTYRAMQHDKDVVIPGRGFGFGQALVSLLPASWQMRISRSQLREIKSL
jgi:short-subunit dehydrogenase